MQRDAKPIKPQIPANPLPAPKSGEANLIEPTDVAEQATWQPYHSTTAHAEPTGHLDDRGLRTEGVTQHPRPRSGPTRNAPCISTDNDK